MNLYHYSYPSEENYDYHIPTDETLGTLSLNINNLPRLNSEEKKTKFIRALIYVKLNEANFEPIHPFEGPHDHWDRPRDEGRGPRFGHRPWEENEQNLPIINIVVTPGIQNTKYVEANPNEYYFSNLTYAANSLREPESKIYTLRLQNKDDDLLVVEISSCHGQYELSITDILDNAGQKRTDKDLEIIEKNRHGKKVIYIPNVKSKVYYLTVRAKMSDYICELKYINKNRFNILKKNRNRYNNTNFIFS
jgi:hypothetical protein